MIYICPDPFSLTKVEGLKNSAEMKKLFFLLLVIVIACNKDDDNDEPLVITKVEYRIDTSVDGAMVKYLNAQGKEEIDYISDDSTWVYTFKWVEDLDSVGFKLKDYITWCTYKIVLNEDTVVNYTGPIPEGGYAGWYDIYYKFD
jgi:hypothetical protein